MIIGIIGGGQLGLMMAEAASKYNHKIIGLDPSVDCPLSYIANEMITAEFNDEKAIDDLVKQCDVITYEFENVDLELVSKYESKIPQKKEALYYSNNRLIEKNFAVELDIETPLFKKYRKEDQFFPSIIKTTTGGYDGKGQKILKTESDIDRIDINDNIEYILEELIDFDYEISVVATRDVFDNIVFYPISKNTHRNGILFTSTVFQDIDSLIVSKAKEYTNRLIRTLDYVGTLAVEYFVIGSRVIFNEFAPRPHNSGHYTIEGCTVSQFENHVLAITKEKVKNTELINPTIMINVLGRDNAFIKRAKDRDAFYHDYRKRVTKADRKMGHITIVSNSKKEAIKIKNDIIEEQS